MNHNSLIWLLDHMGKKFAPIEWAEKCGIRGVDWRRWDKVTLHPSDCYIGIMEFAVDYQRYNLARV